MSVYLGIEKKELIHRGTVYLFLVNRDVSDHAACRNCTTKPYFVKTGVLFRQVIQYYSISI